MSLEKRTRCDACQFLVEQCVCSWLTPLTTSLQVIVVQHPKEAKHAKNTVPLLSLGLPQVRCISAADKEGLLNLLLPLEESNWRLIFPSEDALYIEDLGADSLAEIDGIILLDATWRKAKRLFFTEPLLHRFVGLKFARPPICQYEIRKSPSQQALSTLEACAYAVEQITGQNMQPLRDFMVTAQQWQWRQRPFAHKLDETGRNPKKTRLSL